MRQGECLTASFQGLVRIAKQPQGPGYQEAVPPRIQAIAENMDAILLEIIEGTTLLQVESGQSRLAEVKQRDPQRTVGLEEEGRLPGALG